MLKKISTPILITGAKGFIGSNLLRKLVHEGYKTNIILKSKNKSWRIKDILKKTNIIVEDLNNFKSINKIINNLKPKTIFHLATYGAYEHQNEIEKIRKVNLDVTINLLKTCSKQGFKTFINTGSNSEYGFKKKPMKETDLLEPNSYYAIFKAAATLFCQYESISKKLPIITVRPFHVYGPYEENTRLIPILISKLLNNQCPPLVAPNIVRDMIYIDDVVDFYLMIASKQATNGGIFNIGSGYQRTIKEVYFSISDIINSNLKPKWNSMNSRSWDQTLWKADMSIVKKRFKWKPKNNLKQGLAKTINWHREFYKIP